MKKDKITAFCLLFILGIILCVNIYPVYADWYTRPETRPTQPSYERPTLAPSPTQSSPGDPKEPTSGPNIPTATPRVGAPTSAPELSGRSTSDEDPCAPGKSYTGPNCGWSPRVGGTANQSNNLKGRKVLGLSYTSGGELLPSDIMLLTGVLCLLLYTRSKLNIRRRIG